MLPIATQRLVLRPFRETDLAEFLAYRNDPDVARLQSWERIEAAEAAAFLRSNAEPRLGRTGQWQQIAIALGDGDLLVGDIGLFLSDDGSLAELGFTLAGRHQGRGLAKEAIGALIEALFERPDLARLRAVTDTRNAPAMALLKRLGFQVDSTADASFKGIRCQEHTYVLSREAWPA